MRLFFGLPITDEVRDRVGIVQQRLREAGEKVKWVEPANLHFTLRFLGDVADTDAEQVAQAAEASWEGVVPAPCALRGVGAFPSPRRPRVIWVGLSEGRDGLVRLYGSLNGRLQDALGLPSEPREFVPHLTIGRVKVPPRGDALGRLIDACATEDLGSFIADRFALYQSTLTPRGPLYRVVRSYQAPGQA